MYLMLYESIFIALFISHLKLVNEINYLPNVFILFIASICYKYEDDVYSYSIFSFLQCMLHLQGCIGLFHSILQTI